MNDYLARRDSEWVGQVHRFLGLRVGLVQQGLSESERQAAYGADITYVTNSELGFDYLRDNLAQARAYMSELLSCISAAWHYIALLMMLRHLYLRSRMRGSKESGDRAARAVLQRKEDLVLREFNFCVIDEVDSILIDEARTPLIISGPAEKSSQKYRQAARLADAMEAGLHYTVDEKQKSILITEEGYEAAEDVLEVRAAAP